MTIYKVNKVNGNNKVEIIDTKTGKKKIFIAKIEGFYREGDLVGYDETVDRYVFMDTSASLIANEAIMKITDNGRLKYNELPEVLQELYDEAVECVKECFDKPELMTYQQSAEFAAKRLAAEQVLRGE